MSEEKNLDLTEYDRAVTKHALFGRARSRMFEDESKGQPWNVDLVTGELVIGGQGHRCQILGTYDPQAETFLWAWGNPGNRDWGRVLGAANELRALGEKPGNAVFRERLVSLRWVHPWELIWVSGELAGGHPVYLANTGSAVAFLLVTDVTLDPRRMTPVYIPGVLLEFQSIAMVPVRPSVLRFLQRMEYLARDEGDCTIAERDDGSTVTVRWDGQGRIGKVELHAVPEAR